MTADRRNIVLTGFMASGKTTVGQQLAKIMARPFVDADTEIVRRAGMPIKQIFETQGEPAFRALEKQVCADLAAEQGQVIATGGGMLVNDENRQRMLETGFVVCLDTPPEVIKARLAASQDRPLAGDWLELYEKRRAAYAAIPVHVNTAGKKPDMVAQEIVTLWLNASR